MRNGNYWIKVSNSGQCNTKTGGTWKCYGYEKGIQKDEVVIQTKSDFENANCKILCKQAKDLKSKNEVEDRTFVRHCRELDNGVGRKKRYASNSSEDTVATERIILDFFLDPEKLNTTAGWQDYYRKLIKNYFESADIINAFPNLFKLLWHSNIPCFKNDKYNLTAAYLLKKCLWQGKEYDCSDLFQQVPTDSGIEENMHVL